MYGLVIRPIWVQMLVKQSGKDTWLLLRGSSVGFLFMGLGALIQLGVQLYLTNGLGGRQYGIFIYAFGWLQVLVFLPKMGLDAGLRRFLAAYYVQQDWAHMHGLLRRTAQWGFLLGVAVTLFLFIILFVLSDFINPTLTKTLWIGSVCLPAFVLLFLHSASLQALKHIAFALLPLQILRPLLTVVAVWLYSNLQEEPPDAAVAMLCNVVAIVISLLVASCVLRKKIPQQVTTESPKYESKKWLRVSVPMWLVSGLQQISNWMDVLLIGIFIGTSEAGIYAVASRLARLLAFGLQAVDFISAPMISELYTQKKQLQLEEIVRKACVLSSCLALLIAVLLVSSHMYLLGLFGVDFTRGSIAFLILSSGHIVNSFTGPVGSLLNMTGHQDTSLKINLFGVTINLVLNVPAIMWWGIEGAAVVTSMTIMLQNVWRWFEVYNRLKICSIPLSLPTK